MKIVALDSYTMGDDGISWDGFTALGDFVKYDRSTPDEVLQRATGTEAILINKIHLDEKSFSALPDLRYVGVLATGYDVIDMKAARRHGVAVTNIPAYGTESVAQFTFAHILNLCNRPEAHATSVAKGNWCRCPDFCYRLTPQISLNGKVLGIIGCGRIGQAVARIAKAFGMTVMGVSHHPLKQDRGIQQVHLDQLLKEADFISLHCPSTEETRYIINRKTISQMKPTAFLINTSRGSLIAEQDLADALNSGRLAGAGLDVLDGEPPSSDNPLLSAHNCFITPHIAWCGSEARAALMDCAVENLTAFLSGKRLHRVD